MTNHEGNPKAEYRRDSVFALAGFVIRVSSFFRISSLAIGHWSFRFRARMQKRTLGQTGLQLPILGFGASSLGQEFRKVSLDEALRSVRVALDCGLSFIDTSPFYGRGMSEVLLGIALRDVPRDSFTLCTKLGRYDLQHFDFSARRVAESVDVSLHRLGTDHLDIILCHDIEFVDMQQIVDETLPALRRVQRTRLSARYGKCNSPGFPASPARWPAGLWPTSKDVAPN